MIKDMPQSLIVANYSADVNRVHIKELKALTHYQFEIYAWTAVGRGESRIAVIQSGVEPVLPEPPTKLGVSNIQAFSVVLQFTPGFDGNSSITKWTIEAQKGLGSNWEPVYEVRRMPNARTLTVENLTPFMNYRLRVIANNVVGPSEPSQPTQPFQTIQAPPKHPPRNVTVRAVSATELRVRWIPLQQIEWYGTPRGYNISYRLLHQNLLTSDNNEDGLSTTVVPTGSYDDDDKSWWWLGDHTKYLIVQDHHSNSFVLTGLKEFSMYEVIVRAFNDVGSSESSASSRDQTRESGKN
jgi:protein sidekick